MKIAISTDSGNVSAHFGRCPEFTIFEVEEGSKEVKKETIKNPGHEPGFLPEFLGKMGVSCIIAGGMGQNAKMLFEENKIDTVLGAQGPVDDVIDKMLSGELENGNNVCSPGDGKGYGVDKTECDHDGE